MNYFPLFVSLESKRCLVVGGGEVALRKAEKLLQFGAAVFVVATDFCDGFSDLPVERQRRAFRDGDVEGAFLVIAATSDRPLNRRISQLCAERKIAVNCVDDKQLSSFFFPAYVLRGDVTVGISTGGASPYLASLIRKRAEEVFPPSLGEVCALAEVWRTLPSEEYKRKVEEAFGD